MIDGRILKVKLAHGKDRDGRKYPFNFLEYCPPQDCVFDSFHGTIGFDIYPFAVTTRISASNQIFLKVYDETD